MAKAEESAKSSSEPPPRILGEREVAVTLAGWTGIPVAKMLEGEADKLLKMEERLAQRVVGQEDAVAAVARAVRRGRVGLRDPGKPIGSFLFLGPSGVGKTELRQGFGALPVRRRPGADALGHERVHGAAHGAALDRRAAWLRR